MYTYFSCYIKVFDLLVKNPWVWLVTWFRGHSLRAGKRTSEQAGRLADSMDRQTYLNGIMMATEHLCWQCPGFHQPPGFTCTRLSPDIMSRVKFLWFSGNTGLFSNMFPSARIKNFYSAWGKNIPRINHFCQMALYCIEDPCIGPNFEIVQVKDVPWRALKHLHGIYWAHLTMNV